MEPRLNVTGPPCVQDVALTRSPPSRVTVIKFEVNDEVAMVQAVVHTR